MSNSHLQCLQAHIYLVYLYMLCCDKDLPDRRYLLPTCYSWRDSTSEVRYLIYLPTLG